MQPGLSKSEYIYILSAVDQSIETEHTRKVVGIPLDTNLNYKPHADITLKKAYAKIAPLLRIKSLVPSNAISTLYKAYVLLHFEYCSPLLVEIWQTLNNKLS